MRGIIYYGVNLMASVKRTFSIPDELSQDLDVVVPAKERSKFIALSLRDALAKKKQQAFAAMLDDLQPIPNQPGVNTEDVLRDVREGRADDVLSNSQ